MPDLGNTSVFSQTDASNGSGTMPSWLGSAAPSTLDDAGRALQGAVTREWNWRNFTISSGGTDTKTLTYSVAPAAYYNGQRFSFINGTTNTGNVTLNVNGLGAKNVRKMINGAATALAAGDMVGGAFVEVAYNTAGDYFVWANYDLSPTLIVNGSNGSVPNNFLGTSTLRLRTSAAAALTTGPSLLFEGNSGNASSPYGFAGIQGWKASVTAGDYSGALSFFTQNAGGSVSLTEHVRIDATGNMTVVGGGGLGYGTGSGGAVTQITSKGTAVTLNKTCGQITTHNAALGSGASVVFALNNSTIAAGDVVITTHNNAGGTVNAYTVQSIISAGGATNIRLTNISGGSLSEAVVINFAVIKAVNA